VLFFNPGLTSNQIEEILIDVEARFYVTEGHKYETLDHEWFKSHQITCVFTGSSEELSAENSHSLDIQKLPAADFTPYEQVDESDEMIIIFTSGTTAKPKGVIHCIKSIVGNAKNFWTNPLWF